MSAVATGPLTASYGAPPPLTAPNLPPLPQPTPFAAPRIGPAPTPTPYGAFDPSTASIDQGALNFRLSQGLKQQQRSAAARGTLLTGGTQAAINTNAQGIASDENQKAYQRALDSYSTNRDTVAQNFGQSLNAFNANTGATLASGAQGLAADAQNFGQAQTIYGDQSGAANQINDINNVNRQTSWQAAQDDYARQVAAAKSQNDAVTANERRPAAPYSPYSTYNNQVGIGR